MQDPLFGNKLAAAVLTALLLVFGLPQLTAAILGGGHHGGHDEELHLAYCCVELDFAAAGAVEEEPEVDLATLLASASAAAGERRAGICVACHTFDQGGANTTGPNLWNVVGRDVAAVDGFNYSPALREFGGVWTYERLDGYLANSQEYLPGTAMVQRFPKDDQRADILAYLQSLSSDPVPFPEPAPVEAETASAEGVVEEAAEMVEGAGEAVTETASEIVETAEGAAVEAVEPVEAAVEDAAAPVAGDQSE